MAYTSTVRSTGSPTRPTRSPRPWVLLAAGATEAQWSLWPVFVLAFGAQLAFDAATTWLRIYLATGAAPSKLFDEVGATYLVDALLAP